MGTVVGMLGIVGVMNFAKDESPSTGSQSPQANTNQVLSAAERAEAKSLPQSPTALDARPSTPGSTTGMKPELIWQQDFTAQPNGPPSLKYWNIATPDLSIYNGERQLYTSGAANVRVAGGRLILEAHRSAKGYTSGRIDTKGKVKVEVGSRLEARIRLPRGRGTWPAFWLLSANQPHTAKLHPTEADWQDARFYMWDGEVDIMEAYGAYPGIVEATVHTFGRSQERQQPVPDSADAFHTYWLEWRKDKLVFGVDSTVYNTYKKSRAMSTWPFTDDNQFYIILNLAMGGSGGGQIVEGPADVWRMEVESIKYFRL